MWGAMCGVHVWVQMRYMYGSWSEAVLGPGRGSQAYSRRLAPKARAGDGLSNTGRLEGPDPVTLLI